MSATWIAFARTWNPNNASIPRWPTYDLATRRVDWRFRLDCLAGEATAPA